MIHKPVLLFLGTRNICKVRFLVGVTSIFANCFTQGTYQRNCLKQGDNIMALPKLIVFDLDYTLWPFWVDTHVDPPFHQASNGKVYDAHKQHVKYYKDVPDILRKLHSEGFKLGIASRTGAIHEAASLTRLFNWDQYFHYRQIYPGCKITHFKKLHSQSGIDYEDMLFFDDENRNIHDVSTLGVCCYLVGNGVSVAELKHGFEMFSDTIAEPKFGRQRKKSGKRAKKMESEKGRTQMSSSSSSSVSDVNQFSISVTFEQQYK